MARGFIPYNRPLSRTATGTQGVRPRTGTGQGTPLDPNRGGAGGITPPATTVPPATSSSNIMNVVNWAKSQIPNQEADAYKEYYGSRVAAQTQSEDDEDALAEYLAGGDIPVETVNWGTGSGSGSALARAGATNQNAYFQALLAQAPGQYQGLRDLLASQRAEREAAVQAATQAQLDDLNRRYGTAQADVTKAYDDLRALLEAQAPRAYANLPRATAPALEADAVSRYAQAIGVSPQAIGQAAVQEATQTAGNIDAYNRLLANLQANEATQQASRLAGVGMGRTTAVSGLTAAQQAALTRIEAQKQAALNQILAEIQQGQFGIAQGQLGYEQGLRQALAGLYGTGYVPYTGA